MKKAGGTRMLNFIWPIALVVIANTVYQVCSKSTPEDINPFASLTVTYLVGAVATALLFFLTSDGKNLFGEYTKLNWAPFVLGIVIVGLEAGFIYAYKAGWQVSTASLVQSAFLAVALVFVGRILYHEPISWNKIVGVILCLAGLAVMNRK